MDTLKKIIYDIRDIARAGGIVDDERISFRQVKEWVNEYRALLIRRDLAKKGHSVSDNIVQDLGCVKLIEVDAAECCNINADCTLMRTELKLPRPIELDDMDAIMHIGAINKQKGYERTSLPQVYWDHFNKYTSKISKAFYNGGYVYITNDPFIQYINVTGIFADPTEAANFNKCDGTVCYTEESEYPISNYMLPMIKDLIFQKEMKLSLITTPDTTNDSIGNAEQKGQ